MLQKSIAFFDFDGTITKRDTMLEFTKFSSGTVSYWLGLCLNAPWLLAMMLGMVSKRKAKEKLLSYFFANTSLEIFNNKCNAFNEKVIPHLIKVEAMAAIQSHINQKTQVVIVTASAENWVAPWCRKNNCQFICTRLVVENNKITGKLKGENCNGDEKVKRINQLFNLADYSTIYCYGDTNGDKMMLKLATHPHYRSFKK